MKRRRETHQVLCFNCASIYIRSKGQRYICPHCKYSISKERYNHIKDYAKEVVYYGYEYRKAYENQICAYGKISSHYCISEPSSITSFLGIAALSGIIGGASYDIVKKAIGRILSYSKKNNRSKKQTRIIYSNKIDINIFLKNIQEYHTNRLATDDAVKSELVKEKFIVHLTNAISPTLKKGPPSHKKIHNAVMKAFHYSQNPEKPKSKDFKSFWNDIKNV